MNNPFVSVIVVVANGEKYLASALKSIFTQNYHPLEVIVVDGQSVDKTADIAKSFPSVRYVYQHNRGLANARNLGIEKAQGELIAFLDHDDLWTPNKLRVQVDYLMQNPKIQYVNSLVKLFLEPGCSLRPGFPQELLDKEQVGRTPGTLIARSYLFNLIGNFNPKFDIGCDVDWFTRAKDHNIPMAIIPEVLLYKRIHNTNLSSNAKINKQELLTIIKQSLDRQRVQASNYL